MPEIINVRAPVGESASNSLSVVSCRHSYEKKNMLT
jgi:hypothetical protein